VFFKWFLLRIIKELKAGKQLIDKLDRKSDIKKLKLFTSASYSKGDSEARFARNRHKHAYTIAY